MYLTIKLVRQKCGALLDTTSPYRVIIFFPLDTISPEFSGDFLTRLRKAKSFHVLTKFVDAELTRRVELSRMLGGYLLGDIISQ